MIRTLLFSLTILCIVSCSNVEETPLRLWYNQPAETWTEALPVGNGRLGAMVHGGVEMEHIQFNEETLWKGAPHDYAHMGASAYLDEIRQLLFAGKQEEAHSLAMQEFMSIPLRQMPYQPFGDVYIEFPGHASFSDYERELDIGKAICRTSYSVDDVVYTREVIASYPQQVIAIHLTADKGKSLAFKLHMDAEHEEKSISTVGASQVLNVKVKDGVLKGAAGIRVETDGEVSNEQDAILVQAASSATIWLSASTNFISYKDVSKDPLTEVNEFLGGVEGKSFQTVKEYHMADYGTLFDRFSLNFGPSGRDTIPTDERLVEFANSPDDPSLLALYTQYGRYLMISSSRKGTQPANLQGIWNKDIDPAWGSKYTTNINAEMNYWPAEVTNLSECQEPLFSLIKDCSETGAIVAKEHYGADGWVLHHNTDLWRGTAPINNSNHGMWVGGSGWVSHHLWEHFLFTRDVDFLRERAFPLMMGAATFYSQYLIRDAETGWLISSPSNSPENGGMVAGPTMDHQIIRSLFHACIEAAEILEVEDELLETLKDQVDQIAPNQIGQYGQLQEWLQDLDNPDNKHRHISHLWGMHPARDINWQTSPELMEAAKKTLEQRGDDGTGWSLAWKINFWARLLDGNHAYELIKMQFRPISSEGTRYKRGGGSYPNLFDAHPPFQIDGNFGAPAGIVELLVQSHLSTIDILPSLPGPLPQGEISGVCARGGFELSFSWESGMLTELEVLSKAGENCKLRYQGKVTSFETTKGETYSFNGGLNTLN
jgi:alpha-L-fucosidase 2